jgi:hypothetical protein
MAGHLAAAAVFVLPIGYLRLLLARFSPMNVAFWAIVVTLVVGFAQKETRPDWREFLESARTARWWGPDRHSLALWGSWPRPW